MATKRVLIFYPATEAEALRAVREHDGVGTAIGFFLPRPVSWKLPAGVAFVRYRERKDLRADAAAVRTRYQKAVVEFPWEKAVLSGQPQPRVKGPAPDVAVVVIGRNPGAFLAECLESINRQTVAPAEKVYVDDGSEDSALLAASRAKFRTVAHRERRGMCAARMTGLAETAAPLVLFVDSDNTLPPDYLERMRGDLLAGGHDFVYPHKRHFGHREGDWDPPGPDRAQLWRENYCDTCSLMRRESLLAAGGWRETPVETRQDWSLFLRMSARGSFGRSAARLNYRLHGGNWSHEKNREHGLPAINAAVRQDAARLTVATIWSGRLGVKFLKKIWLPAIRGALETAGKEAEMLVLDDSAEGLPLAMFDGRGFGGAVSVRRIRRPGADGTEERRPDRPATAAFLAAAFQEILETARGDVIWLVEDDIVPPMHAVADLLETLLGGPEPIPAAGGAYKSRHNGGLNYVAGEFDERGKPRHFVRLLPSKEKAVLVDVTGTGCLMLLRDLIPAAVRFEAEWRSADGKHRSPAHDWAFTAQLAAAGHPVRWLPAVKCRHHVDGKEWV